MRGKVVKHLRKLANAHQNLDKDTSYEAKQPTKTTGRFTKLHWNCVRAKYQNLKKKYKQGQSLTSLRNSHGN